MTPRTWYRVQAQADDPSVVDIHIIDFIGDWIDDYYGCFGVTAKSFVDGLAKLSASVKTIRVHINSPGGDVFGAVNIANALRDQQVSKGRTVETIVDGLAASAASIVMMAGSTVRIADNAMVMVHNPWTIGMGNAADMRKLADDLDTVRNTILATYKWHSTLGDDELVALMDATTWMDADEAIANGFATEKVEGLKAAASLDRRAVATLTVPEKYRARLDALVRPESTAPPAASADEVLALCQNAGLDLTFARTITTSKATLDEARTRVAAEQETRTTAVAREKDIRALCATAKQSEFADGYVRSAMSLADVRAHLTTITAKLDRVEIDGGLNPDAKTAGARTINVAAIYDKYNQRKTQPSGG